jgi:CHAD domain-containing protein
VTLAMNAAVPPRPPEAPAPAGGALALAAEMLSAPKGVALPRLPVKPPTLPPPPLLQLPAQDLACLEKLLQQPWKRYRKALKRCQDKFTTEAIHDFRIHIRRLLSSLELLRELLPARRVEKLQRLLKRRLDLFDDLRDTQVELQTLARLREDFPAVRVFRQTLREREERFARRARKEIRKVRTRRLCERLRECEDHLHERVQGLSSRQAAALLLRPVERAFRRACALRAAIDPGDGATIHQTRIVFKQFRYMVEALAPHLPAVTPERLAALRRYQTTMGDIQDSVVLLAALDKFLRKQPSMVQPLQRLRHHLVRHRQRLIEHYLAAADELFTFWPRRQTKGTKQ